MLGPNKHVVLFLWAVIISSAAYVDAVNARLPPQQPHQASNKTLQLNPMPNPYPLPISDLSVDFEEPGQHLSRVDVIECITLAHRKMLQYIHDHGEGHIPSNLAYNWKSVAFMVFPERGSRYLTLHETLKVIDAYAIKNGREGSNARWGNIIVTGAHPEQLIGSALLGPRVENAEISPLSKVVVEDQKIRRTSLQLGPIPNPYPLPQTDLEIDFATPDDLLDTNDALNCISHARFEIHQYLQSHGGRDAPLPDRFVYKWRSVEFGITRVFGMARHISYKETLQILSAFSIKSSREGWRERNGRVIITGGGTFPLGVAGLTSTHFDENL